MKKVKSILFFAILLIISLGLIYLANYFTAPIIEKNFLRVEYADIIDAGLAFETIEEIEFDLLEEGVNGIYRGKDKNGISCLAFDVTNQNQYALMRMIIVIDEATERVLNIHILNDVSHNYKDYFPDYNFGVLNTPISDVNDNFIIVSHATISSTSVKKCLLQVDKQLSLMGGKIVFKELKQNLPDYLNFEYTFVKEEQEVTLLLEYIEGSKTFKYLDTLSEKFLSNEEIQLFLNVANINLPTNWIRNVSVEPDGTRLTIVTDKGFKGEIVAEVKINNKRVVSFELKTMNETYENSPNYTLEEDLKDYLFNNYLLGMKDGIVTGATITSKALNYILALADSYIASLDGDK